MSLRAIGEGHVSSIAFRSGVLDRDNTFIFDPTSDYVERADVRLNPVYDRHLFELKLNEMEACNEVTAHILEQLPEEFTYNELKEKSERFAQYPFSLRRAKMGLSRSCTGSPTPIMRWVSDPITEYPNG